nr:MAG TPA: hypothetical protein [Caudoviricetes sp.]
MNILYIDILRHFLYNITNKVQRPFPEMGLGASVPKWRVSKVIITIQNNYDK